jgi:gamma-glutamyltranspeptidase / glutathione hydrolase
MQEAMRLAFKDRSVWMGDTDVVPDLPVDGLINDQYVALRSATCPDPDPTDAFYCIEVGQRLTDIQAGDPRPYDVAAAQTPIKLAKLSQTDEEGLNTTHFSIVDKRGNIVSYTTTVESGWGTGLMVPGFGFLLNNELTDFNSVPTADADPMNFNPGANDPAAFKRPRSSMAPTILFKGDKAIAAYGSPGGSSIINSVFNMTLNLVDHHMDIQQAIDAPRLSLTSFSDSGTTAIEPGFDPEVLQDLDNLGYAFSTTEIGSVQGVVVDLQTGKQYGGADARRIGAVVGLPRPKNK